ncbi:Adenylate isopentenyltransferase [Vigna angularis]|uniref:Adenylate isopentenyltransferase n=1 Tax=Phaseolus angularis TaxID=3914 RepID=A0A8T0LCL6_PHAAN|nr:Adenylate isopentenyltransferase [Vigna angularis]
MLEEQIPKSQHSGIPHHLLAIIDDPDYDSTIHDFCNHVLLALDTIVQNGHLPIIVGGSNTYLTPLLEDPDVAFRSKYNCCFIWVDVLLPVLFPYLDKRVDKMVDAGVVDEIREAFVAGPDCSRGIRRVIGVPELEEFFLLEKQVYTILINQFKYSCPTTIRYPVPGKVCACVIGCGVCINWTSIAPALESSTVLTFVHESDGGFGVDDNDVDDGEQDEGLFGGGEVYGDGRGEEVDDGEVEGDVAIMKDIGFNAYRFSISWPRILPREKL